MFKRIIFVLVLLFVSTYAIDYKVIAIGVGDKNVTLDESKFPDISVYYVPTMSANMNLDGKMVFKGKPEVITKWFNCSNDVNNFLVVAQNGVIYDQGKSITAGTDMLNVDTEKKGNLYKAIRNVLRGKEKKESKKAIKPCDDGGFIKRKLPNFSIITPDGDQTTTDAVIPKDIPTLVIFFYLNPEAYIGGDKEGDVDIRSKEYMSRMAESMSGVMGAQPLIQVERELFGRIVHEIY